MMQRSLKTYLCLIASGLASCATPAAAPRPPCEITGRPDRVGCVGNEPITVSEYEAAVHDFLSVSFGSDPVARARHQNRTRRNILERTIEQKRITVRARDLGIQVSAQEIEDELARRAQNQGADAFVLSDPETIRRILLRKRVLEVSIVDPDPSDEEVRATYDRLKTQFQLPPRFEAGRIEVDLKTSGVSRPELNGLAEGLRQAETGRENLAREWVLARTGSAYRPRVWLELKAWPREMRQSILALAPGEVSDPIGAGRRIQVVMLWDKVPMRQLEFAEVSALIRKDLRDQALAREKREALRRLEAQIGVLLQPSYRRLLEADD